MKTLITIAALCFFASNSAFGYYVISSDGTQEDVGSEDDLLVEWNSKDPSTFDWYTGPVNGNGEQTELAIADAYLTDASLTTIVKDGGEVTALQVFNDDGSEYTGYFGFGLSQGPGYYLIKNASVLKNETEYLSDTALFLNNADTDWAFIKWDELDIKNLHNFTISHVSQFDPAPPVEVAEPATFGLLALGLTGLIGARRRAKKLS